MKMQFSPRTIQKLQNFFLLTNPPIFGGETKIRGRDLFRRFSLWFKLFNQGRKIKKKKKNRPLSPWFYFPPTKHLNISVKFAGFLFLYLLNWYSQGWRTITTVVWRHWSMMWVFYCLMPPLFLKRMQRCQQKSNAFQNGSHGHYHLYSSWLSGVTGQH